MRINPRAAAHKSLVEREVRRARALGPLPDPVCCASCADYQASVRCNRYCPAAAQRLSSEGDRSPVEPRVAPLVFELKKLGVFYPCWSCEGHEDQEGKLRTIPRIWFYADSVVHIRSLAEAVNQLFNEHRLSARWNVMVTYSDANNPDTTFSLEPESTTAISLDALQGDLRVMSEELEQKFQFVCDTLAPRARAQR